MTTPSNQNEVNYTFHSKFVNYMVRVEHMFNNRSSQHEKVGCLLLLIKRFVRIFIQNWLNVLKFHVKNELSEGKRQ